MRVKDIMLFPVITVTAGATYVEVAQILYANQISGAPVIDASGRVIGMVSEKDLYRVLYPWYHSYYESPEQYVDFEARESKVKEIHSHRVETLMTMPVITVPPDMPVMRAGAIMLAKQLHRLPVVEADQLVGIVTRGALYRRIIRAQLDKLEKSS